MRMRRRAWEANRESNYKIFIMPTGTGNSTCLNDFLILGHVWHICPAVGHPPPEASTVMNMQHNPSYCAVQGGLIMEANSAYEQTSGK